MKKTFSIYYRNDYEGTLNFIDFPENEFFTYQEAETFLIDQSNEHLFEKNVDYTILTIFSKG